MRTAPIAIAAILAGPIAAGAQEIAAKVQPFVDARSLAGAVMLVADRDRVLDAEAVGYSDVGARVPMRTDDLFWIASESKPITAAAFMILVDEGKAALDDPVEKFLPEFKDLWVAAERDGDHMLLKRPRRPITLRDALSHTSGLPFASAEEAPTLDGLTLDQGARSYATTPLMTEPGARFSYSNAGINVAGRVIEVVAHQPYEVFLKERLLIPLGMKDTTFWPDAGQLARLAKAYTTDPTKSNLVTTRISQLRYPLDDRTRRPMPAGGLFSTADDVSRFGRLILGDGVFEGRRILSAAAVGELTRKQTGPEIKDGYGLGFSVGGAECGHSGALATGFTVLRNRNLVLVWMVQHAGFPGDGATAQGVFREAAIARYGSTR